MQKQRGFTLIELLVTIAVMIVLMGLAVPSFKRMIQSGSMSSAVNGFLADLRFARSEAVRRSAPVVMCRADTPEAASPACGTGTGTGGKGWATGWIIFLDKDADGAFDAAKDQLLRVQAGNNSLDAITDNPSSTKFQFSATGRLQSSASVASVKFGGTKFASDVQRVVCVGIGGRARIAGDGSSSCS